MSEQDTDRIRDAITHDQTSCRCGHLLAACADCRDWLTEHSPRIAMSLESWWRCVNEYQDILAPAFVARMLYIDAIETDDLTYYLSWR